MNASLQSAGRIRGQAAQPRTMHKMPQSAQPGQREFVWRVFEEAASSNGPETCARCENPVYEHSKNLCIEHVKRQREVMRRYYERHHAEGRRESVSPISLRRKILTSRVICAFPSPHKSGLPEFELPISPLYWKRVKFLVSGCWQWIGQTVADPKYPWKVYGFFDHYLGRKEGKSIRRGMGAHRFTYEAFVGPLVPGLHVDHTCENKLCVNPDHLEQVTCSENKLRSTLRKEQRGEPAYVWRKK